MKIKLLVSEKQINSYGRVQTDAIISSTKEIKPGEYYLESANDKARNTNKLNRMFHLLITDYFNSGKYSDQVDTLLELREKIKYRLGEGFDRFLYVNDSGDLVKCKLYDEIPSHIKPHPKKMLGQLKSWGDYIPYERYCCVKNLVAEMKLAGVNSKRFQNILDKNNADPVVIKMGKEYKKLIFPRGK